VNPIAQLTEQLQEAYVKAGDDMAKQMAAAVVAILNEATSGHGQPGISGWPRGNYPEQIRQLIPEDKLLEAGWILIVAPEVDTVPLLRSEPIMMRELTSGHRLIVLG
jgi:hypothetical protein